MSLPIDIFLHIPKTGGTSIENAMARNYPPKSIYFVRCRVRNISAHEAVVYETKLPEVQESLGRLLAEIHNVRAIVSFLPYGVHNLFSSPCRYFTMLRDPVERCLSAWFFIMSRGRSHPVYQLIESFDFDLEQVLASKSAFVFHNDQTRYITASKSFALREDEALIAFERLRNEFAAVGLMEDFRRSFNEIASELAWSTRSFGHANKTPHKAVDAIKPMVREALQAQNQCDYQLYQLVKTWLSCGAQTIHPL